jgi:hypothetical protein
LLAVASVSYRHMGDVSRFVEGGANDSGDRAVAICDDLVVWSFAVLR